MVDERDGSLSIPFPFTSPMLLSTSRLPSAPVPAAKPPALPTAPDGGRGAGHGHGAYTASAVSLTETMDAGKTAPARREAPKAQAGSGPVFARPPEWGPRGP